MLTRRMAFVSGLVVGMGIAIQPVFDRARAALESIAEADRRIHEAEAAAQYEAWMAHVNTVPVGWGDGLDDEGNSPAHDDLTGVCRPQRGPLL